jgi:hypothetical protein
MLTDILPIHAARRCAAHDGSPPPRFSAAGGPDDDDSDDLDDELDETGAVTNRSNGKSGTDTTAEPDPKRPSDS